MPDQVVLTQETIQRIESLGSVEIVVGIPSYNNADTIAHVVQSAQAGLHQYYGAFRGLIVNSDGGSTDGTPQIVTDMPAQDQNVVQLEYPVYPVQKLSTPYHGIPGKGSAFRTIFEIAQQLGAKALVVFDSDLRSITPEWVKTLADPVLNHGYDLVAPYYTRHKFDGTITNSIVYPLTRALYGKRVRQPIGGDFAFSAPLISRYISQDIWHTDVARFGIDIWVTTQAICGGFKVCQAYLGAKIHNPKDPSSDLSAMLTQVVGSLFQEMERNVSIWQKVRDSEPVPLFGAMRGVTTEPVNVDVNRMTESYRLGYKNLRDIWGLLLSPAVMLDLKRMALAAPEQFSFPDQSWAQAVYDFALGFRLRTLNRDHLLRALTPLYLAWVASFVMQMKDAGPDEVEQRLEKLCLTYEAQKPYFISRWRWPDRFNP